MLAAIILPSGCAPLPPNPLAVAADQSPTAAKPQAAVALTASSFDGFYAGLWTPTPVSACRDAQPVARTLFVQGPGAASGVNYPLRGFVQPDGTVSLAFGKAALVGRFDGQGGLAGQANTGDGCFWRVSMARQPPVASATAIAAAPAADVVQGEIPQRPSGDVPPLGPSAN